MKNRKELVSLGYSKEPDPDRCGEVDDLLDLIQMNTARLSTLSKGSWLPQ
jgi:hypothetical protein